MNKTRTTPHPTRRRGAALLLVIGLLGLLFIAMVAFSILMTVERNAAVNYRHAVQVRQMLYVGLAHAIADIDKDVVDDAFPQWTNSTIIISNSVSGVWRTAARLQDVLQSIDKGVYTSNSVSTAKTLSKDAMLYIPKALHQSVESVRPECMKFVDQNGQPVGRYAYVAVNVSGLLDANVIGGVNRWTGTNAAEITLSNGVPFDVLDAAEFYTDRTNAGRYESVKELVQLATNSLDPFKLSNFETFSYAPPSDVDPDGNPRVYIGGNAAQLRSNKTEIVAAFTKCFNSVSNSLPMFETDIATHAEWAYNNLVDYVSPISDPPEGTNAVQGELARPATKNAPMIQAVALNMLYGRTQSGVTNVHTVKYNVSVVCSRPFIGSFPPVSYTASVRVVLLPSAVGDTALFPFTPTALYDYSTNISFPADNSSVKFAMFPDMGSPIVKTLTNLSATVSNSCQLAIAVQLKDASGYIADQVPAGNGWLTDPTHFIIMNYKKEFGSFYMPANASQFESHVVWAEALDPTINWNGAPKQGQWFMSEYRPPADPDKIASLTYVTNQCSFFSSMFSAGTIGGGIGSTPASVTYQNKVLNNSCGGALSYCLLTNSAALAWWNTNSGMFGTKTPVVPDGATIGLPNTQWDSRAMQQRHFAKGAPLETVGELGFLPIGRWMTFNLYPHDHASVPTNGSGISMLPPSQFHPVLDYFTVTPTNNVVSRGLVNANSRNPGVHAAMLNNVPINEWKGSATAKRLGTSDATNLAQSFISCAGSISNLSDIGLVMQDAQAGLLAGTLFMNAAYRGEFEREAVIRNTAGLYTTRQQIYTIIVRAEAMSLEYGGVEQGKGDTGNDMNAASLLGSAQAIFQVWRDPIPDPVTLEHRCFVRLCKILSL